MKGDERNLGISINGTNKLLRMNRCRRTSFRRSEGELGQESERGAK